MTVLKHYKNKNIGEFISIPNKDYESNDVLDTLYFSKYMKKLVSSSIVDVRKTDHYENTMNKWKEVTNDVDLTDLSSVESKLRLNINVYNPLKSEMQGGGTMKESYKTVELLHFGKNKYKPMMKITGGITMFKGLRMPNLFRSSRNRNNKYAVPNSKLPRVNAGPLRNIVVEELVSGQSKRDSAIIRFVKSLQSYRKGRKSLMKNYKTDEYYEEVLPYVIFYDKSEFQSQEGGGTVGESESPIIGNDEVPVGNDELPNAKDPDLVMKIVETINANRDKFDEMNKSSPDIVLKTAKDKQVDGITVNNVEVASGKDKMNAKVLKKNGATLCVILQKTVKSIKDITALTLVNSIRINFFYMRRNMKEDLKKKHLQLTTEEYDKIILYTKTTDINGIESIKDTKDKNSELVKDLDELIKALQMRKGKSSSAPAPAPANTVPFEPGSNEQGSNEPGATEQEELKIKQQELETLKIQLQDEELKLVEQDEKRRRYVFETAKSPPDVEIDYDIIYRVDSSYDINDGESIMKLISIYNELDMNDEILKNLENEFDEIKSNETVLDFLDQIFDGIIATEDVSEDSDEMEIDSHFKDLCEEIRTECLVYVDEREQIETQINNFKKDKKELHKSIKELENKIKKIKNPRKTRKGGIGINIHDIDIDIEEDIELRIAQILARLKKYVNFTLNFDIVSCIYMIIKMIFIVYVLFSVKRDIFSISALSENKSGYTIPTVMTAYQVLENPTPYKTNPITLNSMIDAAMNEYDPYFTNTKYDPNTKQIMYKASDKVITELSDDDFIKLQIGVSNVRDFDAILEQYNMVQSKIDLPPILTYNKTGIEELLIFRETVNTYADSKHKETINNLYNQVYVTTKDGLVNECTATMFKDIKFYFTEHVRAMFGTKKGSDNEPIIDYAFMIEHFMRSNHKAHNLLTSVVQDLFTNYVGQNSGDEVVSFLNTLKKDKQLIDKGVDQRFTLLEEQKKSFTNTPYTKSLRSFFEKPSPKNMISELISASVVGDRELTANYFALSLLARMLHTGEEYTKKLETTYKGLYSYEQYFGMLGMQCAAKTYAADFNKYFSNIASI